MKRMDDLTAELEWLAQQLAHRTDEIHRHRYYDMDLLEANRHRIEQMIEFLRAERALAEIILNDMAEKGEKKRGGTFKRYPGSDTGHTDK